MESRNNGASGSATPPAWQDQMDFTRIQGENERAQILDMLHKHASVWNGKRSTIKAMEHRIDVDQKTGPVRSMPYRQGPDMQEYTKTKIEKMLAVIVIEPTTTEWASPVFLFLTKDGILRLCVD